MEHSLRFDISVRVPGSKSMANRALVCAALAAGRSVLHGVPGGDDTAALIECLGQLGVAIGADTPTVVVDGVAGRLPAGPRSLPARLAGTTSRFVTAVAALGAGPYVVDGLPPLRARPMAALHDALAALGATVRPLGEPGHLPVEISGPLTGDRVELPGDVSSQYVTALMLVAPLLPRGLHIELTSELISRPYVEMTAVVQQAFGVGGLAIGARSISVPPGHYVPAEFVIEPDASSASYVFAAAVLCRGRVTVPDLTVRSIQGDAVAAALLGQMGAVADPGDRSTSVTAGDALHGIDVDMSSCSDLVPTMAVVAAFASTPTHIRGVGFIRRKESDRIGDLCAELRRAGVEATPQPDGLTIAPSQPHAAVLDTHHDHRLAMAFGVLGLRVPGIDVHDPGVVSKSWPDFWNVVEALR